MKEELRLVFPSINYEQAVMDYLDEMTRYSSSYSGCAMLEEYRDNYRGWLDKLEKFKTNPDEGYAKSETYLVIRCSDNKLIGMIDLRYELTEYLFNYGGNIGYSVRPTERRKGYAKKMLSLGIQKYKERNINEVLICCNKDNIASAKTIMSNGGVLETEAVKNKKVYQKYWIKL